MKKILYTFIALALGMMSCSQDIEVTETTPADCIMLKVLNSPMTKAVDPAGAEYERKLNRLDCFFYVKGQTGSSCVYYQKVDVNEVGSAEIPFNVDESVINSLFPGANTECDVFVIANLPSGEYAKGQAGTDVPTLSRITLELGNGYDEQDENFLMSGLGTAEKGATNNATGTIYLYRAASKVTITVNIPSQIVIENTDAAADDVVMTPVLTDDTGKITLKSAFHNGVTKTYLNAKYTDAYGASLLVPEDYFNTEEKGYVHVADIPATGDAPAKYSYACEVPFYTYARVWEKGAEDAAYITLELPWKNETTGNFQPYYYQILVNGAGREFKPNAWYDLNVNVGVLGSIVKSEPIPLQDMTYYVLDWTTEPDPEHSAGGDRYEDVEIQDFTYLVVPETRLEINNANSGVIHFDASHKVSVRMHAESKEVEILPGIRTSNAAFYVNCGGNAPTVTSLPITVNNFSIDESKGSLNYTYEIPDQVYSPVYVYVTMWLDFDGDGVIKTDYPADYDGAKEIDFSQDITIVQFPPLYITPDLSTPYSIYVNGTYHTNENTAITINGHNLGQAPGASGSWNGEDRYMYTITVSAFNAKDTFLAPDGNRYPYIIGDPRTRTSDIELDDNANYIMANNWDESYAVETDAQGNVVRNANGEIQYNQRALNYYYPTSSEGNAFQIVSPKFRIVSFHSSGWGNITSKGAEMRCATFQEDGYPAGRWRLPTAAEIMFVCDLQNEDAITDIFYSSSSQYYCATEVDQNNRYKVRFQNNTASWTSGTTGSVRCVYDEWYWGSEREAMKNPNYREGVDNTIQHGNNEYLFTWGDKQIW